MDAVHVCVPPALHQWVAVEALKRDVHVIVEKPFTGFFGPAETADFRGNEFPKQRMREEALRNASEMLEAEKKSQARIFYAENWVFAPVIQKEVEIIEKSKAQTTRPISRLRREGLRWMFPSTGQALSQPPR